MASKANPDQSKPVETHPAGISNAVLEGARQGEEERNQKPAPDAKTVESDSPGLTGKGGRPEQDEAPLGGAPVAFPAPTAQPSKVDQARE